MISGSDDSREHFAPNPGKIDIDGVEWFRTDDSYGWYRWSDGSVVIKSQPLFPPEGSTNHLNKWDAIEPPEECSHPDGHNRDVEVTTFASPIPSEVMCSNCGANWHIVVLPKGK